MSDVAKHRHVSNGALASDLRSLATMLKTRRTVAFAYVFMLCFVLFTLLFAFNPNPNVNFGSGDGDFVAGTRISSVFSYYFPEITENVGKVEIFNPNWTDPAGFDLENPRFDSKIPNPFAPAGRNRKNSSSPERSERENSIVKTEYDRSPDPPAQPVRDDMDNPLLVAKIDPKTAVPFAPAGRNRTTFSSPAKSERENSIVKAEYDRSSDPPAQQAQPGWDDIENPLIPTKIDPKIADPSAHSGLNRTISSSPAKTEDDRSSESPALPGRVNDPGKVNGYLTGSTGYSGAVPGDKRSNVSDSGSVESLLGCDLYDGDWVVDDSYPIYEPGSCLVIDEQFSCISNGRVDKDYLKYKWKPHGCTLPRLDPNLLLQMLKHKRLVFVGDSLNRNMWESMVCILSSAVKNRTNVFESHGRHHFRGEAEYSFVFKDYNFTVEFYVSPFLVQEWEVKDKDGTPKERLRLDLIGKTCDDYKGADILIFNTGHWWTHEKTSLGQDYYQVGRHVYAQLNVLEAFRKALTTWGRWVDANVDPQKSIVLFRGYSASHFSGGQWNSGGACDNETEPIKNPNYLTAYPTKMTVLEEVLNGMKTDVKYLNITRLTDYRKDGHPSIYRKKNIPEAERKSPMRYQDCSHWCLPGVPDTWNELLYAELLIRQHQQQKLQ